MTVPALRRLLIVCFCGSGAAALVYQVAWVRLLTLALGHTIAAASTVLAAFMGGLAIGAWAAGRLPAGPGLSLTRYAVLELFIAGTALVLPAVLAAFDPILISAYADGTATASFAFARIAVSFLLIGVPAAAMGATYPIAVAWLARVENTDMRRRASTSSAAGALYAANSAGAAAGAMVAGFWLIEILGIRGTTWVAVALNVAAAGLALWFGNASSLPAAAPPAARTRRAAQSQQPAVESHPILAAAAAAVSGFAALIYEVTWTRLLALTLGPTTYAFATMAAAFITGIAAGSSLGVRLGRRSARPAFWLGVMLVASSASTILAAWFTASHLPLVVARSVATYADFAPLFLRQTLAIVLVLLPASLSLGATFSLALAATSIGVDSAARQTARVYTANTIGAVAGALAAGFLLVPRLGLQRTFLYAGVLLLVSGSAIAALGSRPAKRRLNLRPALPLLAAGAGVIIVFGAREWDRDLISSGAYKYARQLPADDLESSLRAGRLEYYKEGASGTVSVRNVAGSRSLAIDGKVDASNGADMLTQRLLGLLPIMLHTGPRDALVIGLGSGVTADAMLASGEVRHLDVAEISPEVVEASAYFAGENHDVLRKPAVRLLVGDGRSHLRLSARQYDVIVSEPSNPWMAGVAALFTREFFEAARARLRSGGIFCQWSHTYEIADSDLRSIVRTFASVFPEGTLWLVGEGDLLLIGSVAPGLRERLAAIPERSRMGSVPALLADVHVPASAAPFVLLSMYAGGPRELAHFGSDAALQTDDRMALEFSAARAMHAPPAGQAARLRTLASGASLPDAAAAVMRHARVDDWTALGEAELRAEAFASAHESFRRAVALDSRSARALRGSTEAAAGLRRIAEEAEWLKTIAAADPANAAVRVELSHVMATLGDAQTAVAAALDAVSLDPSSPGPLEQLASVFADVGDAARLTSAADELISRFPERSDGRYYRAAALFLAGKPSDAERAAHALLNAEPRHAKGLNLLGVICASRGDRACARKWFTQSLAVNARDPSVYVNLGQLSFEDGDAATAAEFFGEALTIDPTDEAAKRGLAEASRVSPQRR